MDVGRGDRSVSHHELENQSGFERLFVFDQKKISDDDSIRIDRLDRVEGEPSVEMMSEDPLDNLIDCRIQLQVPNIEYRRDKVFPITFAQNI